MCAVSVTHRHFFYFFYNLLKTKLKIKKLNQRSMQHIDFIFLINPAGILRKKKFIKIANYILQKILGIQGYHERKATYQSAQSR